MSEPTPGPWMQRSIGTSADGDALAVVWPDIGIQNRFNRIADVKGEGNALLIVAAPDLLAACRAVVGVFDGHEDAPLYAQKCRAAIAKAEGRS